MTDLNERHLSGLTFDWVFVRELKFQDNLAEVEQGHLEGLKGNISIAATISDDGQACTTYLRLSFSPPDKHPDTFEVLSAAVEGHFSVVGDQKPTVEIGDFSKTQAPAILMPFLREAIASATSKTRFGQILIPPINVVALSQDMQKAKAEQLENLE